jgi:hypothetical protein
MLRADFGLTENYCGRSQCNHFSITGFAGTQDDEAPISAVAEWERFTTAAFRVVPVAGPHLFLSPQGKFITQVIAAVLSGALKDCGSRAAPSGRMRHLASHSAIARSGSCSFYSGVHGSLPETEDSHDSEHERETLHCQPPEQPLS